MPRCGLFVVSKIAHPNTEEGHPPHTACKYVTDPALDAHVHARHDVEQILQRLRLKQLDLILIHWPGHPNSTDAALAAAKRADIWRALEDCYNAGLARAIGVSNFSKRHLDELAKTARIAPMVNQVRIWWCGVVWCGVVCRGVPKALLPNGKGRDVYPRVQVNGLGCVCCVRAVCKCVVA